MSKQSCIAAQGKAWPNHVLVAMDMHGENQPAALQLEKCQFRFLGVVLLQGSLPHPLLGLLRRPALLCAGGREREAESGRERERAGQ